jgi:hypothetical protein
MCPRRTNARTYGTAGRELRDERAIVFQGEDVRLNTNMKQLEVQTRRVGIRIAAGVK